LRLLNGNLLKIRHRHFDDFRVHSIGGKVGAIPEPSQRGESTAWWRLVKPTYRQKRGTPDRLRLASVRGQTTAAGEKLTGFGEMENGKIKTQSDG